MPLSKSVFKATALSLAIILTLNPLLVAAADLTVAPNSGNTSIGQAGNGVPVVNINTPNANGLSHNKFTDYNVGKQGLILNNNNTKYTNTQLGGTIEFNPNLKGHNAANTILNEVTSGNASRLQGYTEVAGQKAHVIVANPNGVTCNGCGFINTPRVTLTTGKPVIEHGQLNRYDISQGQVTIEGEGLNAGNVSQFDILSRSAQVNAEIHAQELNIIAGQNEVTNTELTVTAKTTTDQTDKPQLAIDSSALGGMYAGAIRLVGTEKGVGVNLAGDMASNSGNIQLDANGKLTVGGSLASNKNIVAKAEQIDINNTAYAANDINVTSQKVTINKSLTSGNDLTINAETLTNKGSIEAGATKTGSGNNSNAKLTLNTKQLNNQGKTIISRGSLDINADTLANQQGKIISKSHANITAKQINNQQASLAAEGKLTLQAETINNQQGNMVGQQGTTITATTVDNSLQGLIYSEQGDINLTATQVNNQQGNIAGQNLTANIQTLDNQQGLIEANQAINYQGETLQNNTGTIHALGKQASQLQLTRLFNNTKGELGVNSNTFVLIAEQLNNTDGKITHTGQQGFTIDHNLLGLAGGSIISQSAIAINQDDWYNNTDIQAADFTLNVKNLTQDKGGKLYLQGPLTVTEGGDWHNNGLIQTNGAIDLNLQGDYWGAGQLLSQSNINLNADNILLDDTASRIQGNGTLNLTANDQLYNEGNILSNSTLQLKASDLVNLGTLGASQDLAISGQKIHNQDGLIFTSGQLTIKADDFYNQRGDLYAHGDINLGGYNQQAMKTLTNHSGTIESLAKININADTLENAREVFNIVTHKVSANVQDAGCSHDCGGDKKDHNFILTEVDRTEVTESSAEAKIVAADDLTIQSKKIDNKFSILASGNNIQIDTDTFNNIGAQTGDVTTQRFLMTWRMGSLSGVFNLANIINTYDDQNSTNYDPSRNIEQDVNQFTSPSIMVIDNITKGPTLSNAQVHSGVVQAAGTVTINAKDGDIANNSIKPSYIYTSGGDRVQDTNTLGNDIATYVPVNSQLKPDTTHSATDPLQLPGFSLPNNINGLFHVNTNPDHKYLVETNPAFGVKSFINSDYLLSKLGYNPDETQRRLGDGMYEQRLIQQAITARTGQYFVNGMTDGDQLYQYLMDNAIASKEALKLTVGVGLTAEQVAALTHDIVWLEEREVQGQKVLVPIVYMAQTEGRLAPTGSLIQGYDLSLIVGNNLTNTGTLQADQSIQARAKNVINGGLFETNQLAINATDNIINTHGGIIKGQQVDLTAEKGTILNQRTVTTHQAQTANSQRKQDFVSEASSIESDGTLNMTAGYNIENKGSAIIAKDATLTAGNSIQVGTTTTDNQQNYQGKYNYDRQQINQYESAVVIENTLTAKANNDINVTGSYIGTGGDTSLTAGNTITVGSVTNENRSHSYGKKGQALSDTVTQQGAVINSGGKLNVAAGKDITLEASTVTADKEAYFYAGNDINLLAKDGTQHTLIEKTKTSSNGLSSKTKKTYDETYQTTAQGSLISADSVTMQAKHDVNVKGSDIVSTQDTNIYAGNNVTIDYAEEQYKSKHKEQEKKSGVMGMGGGGIGFTIGSSKVKQTIEETYNTAKGSTIGSSEGSVNIAAGKDLTAKGASIVAGKDITLQGQNVTIEEAREDSHYRQTYDSQQTGLTISLGGTVGSAINTASQTAYQAKHETNDRLSALTGIKSALTGYQAYQATQVAQQGSSPNDQAIGINVSLGQQKAHSEQTQTQNTSKGSSLQASNNITVIATGDKANPKTGDITIKGSDLQAGNNITLQANNDLNLLASENTQTIRGKNSSSGGSIGVGVGIGSNSVGFTVNASLNQGRGKEKGDAQTWTETDITAGNKVTLSTGQDANLIGAQVSGKQVEANIGNNLNLQTLQDRDDYTSKQQDITMGGSYAVFGVGGSGSFSVSQQKMDSTYKSTQEQTGIYAGEGGYQITVGKNTDLNGSVLASTADASKNKLDTGTLTWNNLENKADYKVSSNTVGMGSGGSVGDMFLGNMANTLLVGANNSDKKESTTYAAVSEGEITIHDQANQTQDVASLNRDTEHANNGFSPIFDKEKEQNRLNEMKAIGELGSQISDVIRTEGSIYAYNEAHKAHPNLSADELKNTQEYKDAMKDYGTGGNYQKAAQAITAALQGLAGNNLEQALTGASSPYVAGIIKQMTEGNEPAHLMAHAVWGAIVANAKDSNAAAGAIGAATAEGLAPYIQKALYGDRKISELTEEEKQTITALATIGAGLAGSFGSDGNFASGVAAAETGKNAVENNHLSPEKRAEYDEIAERYEQNCNGELASTPDCQNDKLKMDVYEGLDQSTLMTVADPNGYGTDMTGGNIHFSEGMVVDCVPAGKCVVTGQVIQTNEGLEYVLKPITDAEAYDLNIQYNKKLTESLANIGNANMQSGCLLTPAVCELMTLSGMKNPFTGEEPDLSDKLLAGSGLLLTMAGGKVIFEKPTTSVNKNPNSWENVVNGVEGDFGYLNQLAKLEQNNSTIHTIVNGGKAPQISKPNSIYEVQRADGSKSVTYYDAQGNWFAREDYGQIRSHGQLGFAVDGKAVPHEHKILYNERNQPIGSYYRELDSNGKPIGNWISDKK